jgi:hypothetical protein
MKREIKKHAEKKDSDSSAYKEWDADYKSKYKRPSVANPSIAKMNVGQYKKYLANTFNFKVVTYKELTENSTKDEILRSYLQKNADTLTNMLIVPGGDLGMALKERNKNGDNVNVNINAPTTVINKQTPQQSISKPTSADRPAIAGIP